MSTTIQCRVVRVQRLVLFLLLLLMCTLLGCADKQADLSARLDAEVVGKDKGAIYYFLPPFLGLQNLYSVLPFYVWDCKGEENEHIVCGWRWRVSQGDLQYTLVRFDLQNGTVAGYQYIYEYHDVP